MVRIGERKLNGGNGVMDAGFSLAAQIGRTNQIASHKEAGFLFKIVGEGRSVELETWVGANFQTWW